MPKSRMHRIGALMEATIAGGREMLQGIHAYALEHRLDWRLFTAIRIDLGSIAELFQDCDGIIATATSRPLADALIRCKAPCVNVSQAESDLLPTVCTDGEAIGRMGAEHLINRGFRKLAFYQSCFETTSALNLRGFRQRLQEAGLECIAFRPHIPSGASEPIAWRTLPAQMKRWVRRLPRPAAIMASNDSLGRQLVDTCRDLNIRIPDQIAVLGVNNDDRLCDCGTPTLSSVRPNYYRIGYQAAALLERLMAGQPPPDFPALIAPTDVVLRQSTNTYSTEDARVTMALSFIQKHACDPVGVKQVLEHVGGCRRTLERRFREISGQSPHDAIRQVRLEKARTLLLETNLPQHEIAKATGFYDASALRKAFRQATGTPLASCRQSMPRPLGV